MKAWMTYYSPKAKIGNLFVSLWDNAICMKCAQEESSYHISYFANAQLWLGIELRSLALHG
jgi:hypothetical protein